MIQLLHINTTYLQYNQISTHHTYVCAYASERIETGSGQRLSMAGKSTVLEPYHHHQKHFILKLHQSRLALTIGYGKKFLWAICLFESPTREACFSYIACKPMDQILPQVGDAVCTTIKWCIYK